jgi:two-component system, NtrC family, response regulator GlrR
MRDPVPQETLDRVVEGLALAQLVGSSPAFRQSIADLPRMARNQATILLYGETGTGKELTARGIHYLSPRAGGPFVAVNCGALPETLLEDELFGHERGAFTDAREAREGLVAQAEGGTLFLDEVDALSPRAQVSVLRVLQERRYRPLGSRAEQQADVRVVAASNTCLEQRVKAGLFRQDLYYRLCLFLIRLPPLRERREDILLLSEHFLVRHAVAGGPVLRLSARSRDALLAHDWPGNVRELENAIVRATVLCPGGEIEVEHLGLPSRTPSPEAVGDAGGLPGSFQSAKRQVIARFERDYLTRLMTRSRGNVSAAARTAGKDRRELGKLLKKHHIDPRTFHDAAFSSAF